LFSKKDGSFFYYTYDTSSEMERSGIELAAWRDGGGIAHDTSGGIELAHGGTVEKPGLKK
jgi:hypothetical protein